MNISLTFASLRQRAGLAVIATALSVASIVVVATPASAATCDQTMLRRGNTGYCVQVLQGMLNRMYHTSYPYMYTDQLAVDGIFGYHTDQTVRTFQAIEYIGSDGIVGPITWNHVCFPHNVKI